MDAAAHRVHAAKDFSDRAILARCVATLKDDEQSEPAVGVELVLQLLEPFPLVLDRLLEIVFLGQILGSRSVGVVEADLPCGGDGPELSC